jgi:homoserine/homoserine lactone efflux protein
MSPKLLLLYFVTWSLVALTPGPAVICSMTQATRHGFRSSLIGISGIQFGNFLFFVCIALGIGTLLATATTAFTVLRVMGAVYLLYLGIRIMAATIWRPAGKVTPATTAPGTRHNLFLQGLLIQVTNPKALLFVSALLPQFIEPHRSVPLQLAILVVATMAVDFVVLSSYALLAQRGLNSFRASRFSRWLERVFGATLVFFGVRLLVSRE